MVDVGAVAVLPLPLLLISMIDGLAGSVGELRLEAAMAVSLAVKAVSLDRLHEELDGFRTVVV